MMKRATVLLWIALFISSAFAMAVPDTVHEIHAKVNGREVYLAYRTGTEPQPVLLAIHGSGREAASYIPGHPKAKAFYIRQRDLALKNSYVFVVVSNGKDTWGTDTGLATLLDVYDYVRKQLHVREKWVFWASSAGGILMYRMIREHPGLVEKALGTFPVYDMKDAWHRLKSARKAWPDTTAFSRINPAAFPAALCAVPLLIFHGSADLAVPVERHSGQLIKKLGNCSSRQARLVVVPGGHSTENMALYNKDMVDKFLAINKLQ